MDSFWAQDVINNWNDEYSPKKIPVPPPISPVKKSIVKADRVTKDDKKAFAKRKHAIADAFLEELDTTITQGKIGELAASTGGVKIIWSKKLNTTAGRANWKRETLRPTIGDASDKPIPTYRHHAAIELAEKVIDDEDRLLNVLAHEFCHLANFMVSNIKTNPHGKEFKAWASKVGVAFGGRGVTVTTKHSYEIEYKYVWECEMCGCAFRRHSRSIDVKKHRCGVCKGLLVQTKPARGKGPDVEKVLGEYQLFVKAQMGVVKKENPGSPQKEIMALVGKRYQMYKANKVGAGVGESLNIEVRAREKDEVQAVIRKLDFLDLTSP
jgi:predicted SprT family Zn-dependent metalloprotease